MKAILKSILILSAILVLLNSCKQTEYPIINCIKQLPEELKPNLVKQFPDFLKKDTINIQTFRTISDNEVIFANYIGAGESYEMETMKLYESKNDKYLIYLWNMVSAGQETDPISGLSGFIQYSDYHIKVLTFRNKQWIDISKNAIPEMATKDKFDSEFITCDLIGDTLLLSEYDKSISLLWKDDKFKLISLIPEKFGKKQTEKEIYAEFYNFWEQFSTAYQNHDTLTLIKLTEFPLLYIWTVNTDVVDEIKIEKNSVSKIFSGTFFFADRNIKKENFKRTTTIPSFLADYENQAIFLTDLVDKYATTYFYYAYNGADIKLIAIENAEYNQ